MHGAIITVGGKDAARFYADDTQELEETVHAELRRITAQQVKDNLFVEVRVCYV